MVKDESDIIRPIIEHMLTQVDHVIVADNLSTDGTLDILNTLPIEVLIDEEVGYYQARKMTALAQAALDVGATWVVPFDADEWITSWAPIKAVLATATSTSDIDIFTSSVYNYVPTGLDPAEPDPIRRIGWRNKEPLGLPKVICRAGSDLVIHQGNHAAHYEGHQAKVHDGQFETKHFPYRSAEQFEKKVLSGGRAYEASDLPEDVGGHWRAYYQAYQRGGSEALADHFRRWFWVADPTVEENLVYDPIG